MPGDIHSFNQQLSENDRMICDQLARLINEELLEAESKIWHRHPVWFLDQNPVVGYCKQKPGIRLMFWSGADFDEKNLINKEGKFRDASIFYTCASEIVTEDLVRWLKKSREIQWDYKNIRKRKGELIKIITNAEKSIAR
jgi:hypothetical protein